MSRLMSLMGMALDDAGRAESLMSDAAARRALRNDPQRTLQIFELRAQEIAESIAIRKARGERRDFAVGNARRQMASGARLPA